MYESEPSGAGRHLTLDHSIDYDRITANNAVTGQKEGRNNLRLSVGLVFKIK